MIESGDEELVRTLADNIISKLNNYWENAEVLENEILAGKTTFLDAMLTPECSHRKGKCNHAYPAWFLREARIGREVNRLRAIASKIASKHK